MMFAKLTIDHPDIGKLFPFGGKQLTYAQLLADSGLRAHGKRVMETIGSVLEDLEDMELVMAILTDLGRRHNGYKAKKTHIRSVGEALMHVLQEGLGAEFTAEVRAAWVAIYDIVSDTMSASLSEGPMSERHRELVQKTWSVLALDPEQHGAVFFAKLVSDHPRVGKLFPFGGRKLSYSQLLRDRDLRSHGRRVMETVGQAVVSLGDLDILVPTVRDLGRRHVGYGVTKQHFAPVGGALMYAIREGLGGSFSDEVKNAWLAVWSLVVDTMSDVLPDEQEGPLSTTHKDLVQETWKTLSKEPEKHGATMFAKLTTSHPSIGKLFNFGGQNLTYDQLLRHKDVKAHGRRVMETVGQAVNGLDDLDLLVPILQDLARRHVGYNVKREQFIPVGEALMHAIEKGLGPSFSPEVQEAWSAVFEIVVDTMSALLPEGPITAKVKQLVQASWSTLGSDLEEHGAVMFAKLVTDNPQIGRLFPFGRKNLSRDELLVNPDLRAHGKRIMDTVGVAVSGLDDLELLVPILQDLGRRHVGYGVTKRYFKPVGEALMYAIKQGLGSQFTAELEMAWLSVFKVVTDTMSEFLPDGRMTKEQKNLVKKSWRAVSPEMSRHGAVLFATLVTDYPEIGTAFSFGRGDLSYKELLADHRLKAHGLQVMKTIGTAIKELENIDRVVSILKELGKRHDGYGVKKEYFAPVGRSLIKTIEGALGNAFDDEVKDAWMALYQLVEETMSEGLVEKDDGQLTAEQRDLVKTTWRALSRDPARHGAVMFSKLVTAHPEIGRLFPFGVKGLTYDQLLKDPDVRSHGQRVMDTVGHAVNGLDDLDLLVPVLQDLAKRHIGYKVTKSHFKPVGEALMHAIKQGLGSSFDDRTEAAWGAVFKIVVDTMSEILPESTDQGPLTQDQKRLVQTTWSRLSSEPAKHGAVMFAKLTTDHSDVGRLFPFGDKGLTYDQLLKDPDVRSHGRRVMETVGHAVNGLDDLDLLVPILQDLARRHVGYNVTKGYFQPVGEALMHAIQQGLGSSFDDRTEAAWRAVFKIVIDTMSEILPDSTDQGPLTQDQKRLVQTTWTRLSSEPAKHGAVMFAKLTADHPDVGRLFPFGDKGLTYDQLLKDPDVRSHGRRVMDTVGHAVNGLDDLDLLVPILQDLARRHVGYNVTKGYFQPVGEALMYAIQQGLGSSFDDRTEAAWGAVFKIVVDTMSEILPESTDQGPLTRDQKRLVQTTWARLSSEPAKHGAVMFAKLTTDHPDVGRLFPFGAKGLTYDQLLKDPDVRSHGRRVMDTVGHAVNGLDDLDLLVPILQDLARRHVGYNVTKDHFEPVGEALMHAIKHRLGSSFDDRTEAAWGAVFKIVVDTMSEILPESTDQDPLTRDQKRLVQTTWARLSSEPAKHGAVMFAKLTTDHPDVGRLFPFGGKNLTYHQLLSHPDVAAHGRRVMETVGHAVNGLDDLDLLVPILQELAGRHVGYGVTRQHFQPVGAALIYAIGEGLGEEFTSEVEGAWLAVFDLVVSTMSEVLEDGGALTTSQKALVRQSWQTLSTDPAMHGAVMFAKLITDNPEVGKLFPFGRASVSTYKDLVSSPEVRAHGRRVMETVGHAVSGLDDLDLLIPVLKELASRHVGYGVCKYHFQPVGEALLHAIKEGLGEDFSVDMRAAWTEVFRIVSENMSDVLPDGGPLSPAQKQLVRETWTPLAQDLSGHGAVMFAKLLTDHPRLAKLFPFGGKGLSYQELTVDEDVRAHGLRVMRTVGEAVDSLDDLDLLVPILQDLAGRHVGYGVTKEHFAPVGAALLHAIEEGLGDAYNAQVEGAWLAVFNLVVDTMSDKLPDGLLTSRQKALVRETWGILSSDPAGHGAVMFARLVTRHPSVGRLFPFGRQKRSYDQLLALPEVRAHGQRVMSTVGKAVDVLDDLDTLVPVLEELAIRHQQYGVTKKHFAPVEEALMHAITAGLGSKMNEEVANSWRAVFELVTSTMSAHLPDDDGALSRDQIELVRDSWKKLSGDLPRHGTVMFARLASQNPVLSRLFNFGGKNLSYGQLLANTVVRAHGTRVMETVGHAVDALDELDLLVPVLKDLAARHVGYNVTKLHFKPVSEALLYAIRLGLGKSHDDDIEAAWTAVFQLISSTMSDVLPDGPLSSQHLELVTTTWDILAENPVDHGAVVFAKIVTDHPLVGSLFSFGGKNLTYDELLQNEDLRKHGRRFMDVVGNAVKNLENHEILVPTLEDLAKRHVRYGVTRQHLSVAGEAFMYAIEQALDEGFVDEIRRAWESVFQLVVDVMSHNLPDGRESIGHDIAMTITNGQREIIRSTWSMISVAPDKHGTVVFAKLVSENPKIGRLFQFGKKKQTYKKLLKDKTLIAHGERFVNTMNQIVGGLDDIDFLVPTLQQLALRHVGYGVIKEHLPAARNAFLFALKQGLGKSVFTKEVQDAWSAAFKFVEDTMSEKM
ncbi:uncharacterized protein [Diadema setosum]|uniref:uncharacterized protein n=1 Tax=Diadema setosum TaxID=31175 RepID=UPI003B3BDA81